MGVTLRHFLKIVWLTIISYRIGTYIVLYLWGNTAWWHGVYTDQWNHYQIGAILVPLGLIALNASRYKRTAAAMIAVGVGMILDEVSDIVKVFFPTAVPPNFRDSIPDLTLIVVTGVLFSLLTIGINDWVRRRKAHDHRRA
jgi:hypothetical protein